MLDNTRCGYCGFTGAGKGLDDLGHLHCRRCPDVWSLEQRAVAASGNTWLVCCDEAADSSKMLVTAVKEKPREAPQGFAMPHRIYRQGCHLRMITIVVGKDEGASTFIIEEPLLTCASAYFQKALQQTFKEGVNDRIELEEEDPAIFGLLNEYLHHGSIHQTTEKPADYCLLWLLAHYLQIHPLMNYCMWRALTLIDEGGRISLLEAEELYARAPMDSILRKFLVHLCVWGMRERLELSEAARQDMLRELVTVGY